jgi:hypothetical protein
MVSPHFYSSIILNTATGWPGIFSFLRKRGHLHHPERGRHGAGDSCHPLRCWSFWTYRYLLPEKKIKRHAHCVKNLVHRDGELFFNWKFRS